MVQMPCFLLTTARPDGLMKRTAPGRLSPPQRTVLRVLLVDDNPSLLLLLAEDLRLQCEVLEAGSYAQALPLLEGGVDAVVTDYDLGDAQSGLDLLRDARTRAPAAARLLITGSRSSAQFEGAVADGLVQALLWKPLGSGALHEAMTRLLGCAPEGTATFSPRDAGQDDRPSKHN